MDSEFLERLPLGVESFDLFHDENLLYADKTELLYKMLKVTRPYFLSRPRRFGKTLLIDTLKRILEGRRDLFEGLWIYDSDYRWDPHPVVHLSLFAVETDSIEAMKIHLIKKVSDNAEVLDVEIDKDNPSRSLESLIKSLYVKNGEKKVAVLIDEYDAPILQNINDPAKAEAVRGVLKTFYGVLKDCSRMRGFTFITGVARFPKASIFSELNNLVDLTLDEKYASICGLTVKELDSMFNAEFLNETLRLMISKGTMPKNATIARLRDKILEMYDGYSWDGQTRVLNPWSILNFFSDPSFDDFWYESGTPEFLKKLVTEKVMGEDLLQEGKTITKSDNAVDILNINIPTLMFQAGYFTIDQIDNSSGKHKYHLRFPNLEVKASIAPLLMSMKKALDPLDAKKQADSALAFLTRKDASKFSEAFESFLNSFPYEDLTYSEACFRKLMKAVLLLAGQRFIDEGHSGEGRLDIHFKSPAGDSFIIEVKYYPMVKNDSGFVLDGKAKAGMAKLAHDALNQIELRRYAKRYQGLGSHIYNVAIVVGGRSFVLTVIEEAENWQPAD
jgi:hypothetical protein